MKPPSLALRKRRIAKLQTLGHTGNALKIAGKITAMAPSKISEFTKQTGFVPEWNRFHAFSEGYIFPKEKTANKREFGYSYHFRKETVDGTKSFTLNLVVGRNGNCEIRVIDTSGNKLKAKKLLEIQDKEVRDAAKAYIQILDIK